MEIRNLDYDYLLEAVELAIYNYHLEEKKYLPFIIKLIRMNYIRICINYLNIIIASWL
jgi:hypothetical protein